MAILPTKHTLDLLDITEIETNSLRLVAAEAIGRGGSDRIVAGISEVRPITVGDDSKVFELIWQDYAAYTVMNESYANPEENEVYDNPLREYGSSRYLNFITAATFARDVRGPLRHWRLACNWHVIDVVSWLEPEFRQIQGYWQSVAN